MGTQCNDDTPDPSLKIKRNIQFKTLTSTDSDDSVRIMDQIIHKKPVQIQHNYKPRGQISNTNFGTKDSYRPDTEENQVFLTKKFSKQHMAESDDDNKSESVTNVVGNGEVTIENYIE